MIGKGPDQKRSGPFREYRTCVMAESRARALSTLFFNRTQMCGRSASRPRRWKAAHLRSAGAKRL
ncbi:unnamed protein product, partial [Staurois parvus]